MLSHNNMVVYTAAEANQRRTYIHDTLISRGMKANFDSLSNNDLERIWNLYDEVFFGGQIHRKLQSVGSTLKFQVTKGKAEAHTAGWCQTSRTPTKRTCHFVISIPAGVYFALFRKGEKGLRVNGCECTDRLHCLQMVMEHEGMHLLMQLYGYQGKVSSGPGKKIYSGHGKLFQCMVKEYFGHTDFRHGMNVGDTEGFISPENVKIGMLAKYKDPANPGGFVYGKIVRVHQRSCDFQQISPVLGRTQKVTMSYLMQLTPDEEKDIRQIQSTETSMYLNPKDIHIGMKVKYIGDVRSGKTTSKITLIATVIEKKIKKVKLREISPQPGRVWTIDMGLLMSADDDKKKDTGKSENYVGTIQDRSGRKYIIKVGGGSNDDDRYYDLFDADGKDAGGLYIKTSISPEGEVQWHIDTMDIYKDYRGMGLCTTMLTKCLEHYLRNVRFHNHGFVRIESKYAMAAYKCYVKAAKNNGFYVVGSSILHGHSHTRETFDKNKSNSEKWEEDVYFKYVG